MRISDGSSDVCSSDLWGRVGKAGKIGILLDPQHFVQQEQRVFDGRVIDGHGASFRKSRVDDMSCLGRPSSSGQPAFSLASAFFTMSMKRVNSRSEEYKAELQSLMRISYTVYCLKKKY